MQNQKRESQSFGIELADIYYILFRHKWKIIFCCTLGVVLAAVLYVVKTPLYQSEAKLFVRYVLESKSISAAGSDSKVKRPDEAVANRLLIGSVVLRWNWNLDPLRFIQTDEEPDLGYAPLAPAPRMVEAC